MFDINETVLNLGALRPKFKLLFGDENYTDTWFAMLLHLSTVSLLTSVHTDFGTLSKIALESLAAKVNVELLSEKADDLLNTFSELPPHEDIKPALKRLRSEGFKVVAFSNSSKKLIEKQIRNADLNEYFDEIISVEEVNTFKPSAIAYKYASEKLNCDVNNLRLVATHDWDTHGAMSVGMKAAYINRMNAIYNPLYLKPDILEQNMASIVNRIISIDG
nr:haloacid dehalogenase type II [Vibrio eleionomae]